MSNHVPKGREEGTRAMRKVARQFTSFVISLGAAETGLEMANLVEYVVLNECGMIYPLDGPWQ